MDSERAISLWHKALELESPTVGGLLGKLSPAEYSGVYPWATEWRYLGDNLLLKARPGVDLSNSTRVLSVTLIVVSDYLTGETMIRTGNLDSFRVYGVSSALDAERFAEELRRDGRMGISVASSLEEFGIAYASTRLEFRPLSLTAEPAHSRLVAMEYFFEEPSAEKPYVCPA